MTVVVVLVIVVLAPLLAGSLIGLAFSLLWLALVGIAASLLGGILADLFDVGWLIQFLVAVALAAIGITVFASTERGRTPV